MIDVLGEPISPIVEVAGGDVGDDGKDVVNVTGDWSGRSPSGTATAQRCMKVWCCGEDCKAPPLGIPLRDALVEELP